MQQLISTDGSVFYAPDFLSDEESGYFFQRFSADIPWENDRVKIFGKEMLMRRKSCWFADDGLSYRYSGISRQGLPWPDALLELKQKTEAASGEKFNSCLANFYHDGSDGMGWHSDNEKEIVRDSTIASVSIGCGRKFLLRHNLTKETISLDLENGSLLLMKGELQRFWKHSVGKSAKIKEARMNLTFRQIIR